MSQHRYSPSVTTSSGAWSGNTAKIIGGICCQVYVKSSSDDTTFDLSIQDSHGVELRKYTDAVNVINDLSKWSVYGIMTFTISNASADEDFTLLMLVEEF